MRLTSFVVSRSWASNRLRTGLTILGIAIGVAIVTAIHVMDHNTIQSRIRAENPDFGRVDLELVPHDRERPVDVVRAELEADPDVAEVGLLHAADVAVNGPGGYAGRARLYGLSPLPSRAFDHYTLIDGEDLTDLDGDTRVLVAERFAAAHNVRPGDRLVLRVPEIAPRARCIDGRLVAPDDQQELEARPAEVVVKGIVAHRNLARREMGQVVIGSFALARRLAPGTPGFFQIARRWGADLDALRQRLEQRFVVHDERTALLGESSDERAFRNGVKLLGGLALVLGMFVVFQTLSQSLVERMRQIGLLRCLGASRGAVASVFLVDALGMALIGVLLGLVLGIALAWLLQQFEFSSLGMHKEWQLHELPVRPLTWTAVLGIVFTLAGALFPLWRARGLPVLRVLHTRGLAGGTHDVLRGVNVFLFALLVVVLPLGYLAMTTILTESERETRGVLLQLGALLGIFGAVLLMAPGIVRVAGRLLLWPLRRLLPLPVHLVRKNLDRQTGRFAASVCGLGIVLLAWIALESLTTSLHHDARAFGRRAMAESLYVRGSEPMTEAEARRLGGLDGVTRIEVFEGTRMQPFQVSGMDAETLAVGGGPLHDAPALRERWESHRCLVISRRLAHLHGLGPGDATTLVTDGGPVAYQVIAVSDAVGFFPDEVAWALTAPRWMQHDFCVGDRSVERVTLRLHPDARRRDVLDAARAIHPHLEFAKFGDDIVAYLLRDVTRDFRLFQVLLGMILVLAGVGLLNAMTIAGMARVREIGVLRALGTTRRQLVTAALLEGAVTGVLASVVAIALGVPLGRLVVGGMNRVTGLQAPWVVPEHAILAVPVLGIGMAVVAALVPGLRAGRMSPAAAVRFE